MLLHALSWTSDGASCMLEGAVHNGGRAVLEDVSLNFVTGDAAVGVAPVRTRDWEAGAVVEVALQRVVHKVPLTVLTFRCSFVAFVATVVRQEASLQQRTALVFAMHKFVITISHVVLHLLPREFLVAELAFDDPLGAGVAEMILHADSGDAGGTVRRTLNRIPLADVQVGLQRLELVFPVAALFRVDAVYLQRAYFCVRLHVWVDHFRHPAHGARRRSLQLLKAFVFEEIQFEVGPELS